MGSYNIAITILKFKKFLCTEPYFGFSAHQYHIRRLYYNYYRNSVGDKQLQKKILKT